MRNGIVRAAGVLLAGWISFMATAQTGAAAGPGQMSPHEGQMPPGGHRGGHGASRTEGAATADYATMRWSEHRRFRVSYAPQRMPMAFNALQTWTLTVTDPEGGPIADARLEVSGDMPEHGHGLPTAPQVRDLGDLEAFLAALTGPVRALGEARELGSAARR